MRLLGSGSVLEKGRYVIGPTHPGRAKVNVDVVLETDHVLIRDRSNNASLMAIPYPNITFIDFNWMDRKGLNLLGDGVFVLITGLQLPKFWGLTIKYEDPVLAREVMVFIKMPEHRAEKAAEYLLFHRDQFMRGQAL